MTQLTYKLDSMPDAQCRVVISINDASEIIMAELVSYHTTVIRLIFLDTGRTALYCSGIYSATTARHINRFTREFFGQSLYYECTDIARTGKAVVKEQHSPFARAVWYVNHGKKADYHYN